MDPEGARNAIEHLYGKAVAKQKNPLVVEVSQVRYSYVPIYQALTLSMWFFSVQKRNDHQLYTSIVAM